jgi:glycosyltransferase 2 family protein
MNLKNTIHFLLRYVLTLGIAGLLLWYVFKGIDFQTMLSKLKDVEYGWIYLSIFLALISNIGRAYRWNLLFEPIGFGKLSLYRTFLAVMVGYIANLVFPRMGEVSKCGVMNKLDKIPLTSSLGTVVAERLIDLLSLIVILGFTFLLEFNRLSQFFGDLAKDKLSGLEGKWTLIFTLGILFVLGLVLLYWFLLRTGNHKWKNGAFYTKIRKFLGEMISGLTSIRYLKNPAAFWISTFFIWFCYYLMAYVVTFSMEETSSLSPIAGLTLLAVGSIGMAAPVQGGIGVFHILVGSVLVLYGIPETDGILFATILHTSQALFIIVLGGLSLVLVAIHSAKISKEKKIEDSK